MHPRRRRVVVTLSAAAGVVSLAMIGLGRVAGGGTAADLTNQAGWLLPAGATATFLWLLAIAATRRARLAAGAGLIIAGGMLVVSLLAMFASPWPVPQPGGRAIRIVQFNAWLDNRAPARASRWIIAQRPDVVVLIEAAGRAAPIAAALARELPYRTSCRLDRPCSTLILSRIRPIERRGLANGDADNRQALSAAYVRFAHPSPAFAVLAVHLSHGWPSRLQKRDLGHLLGGMHGTDTWRLIVTGDFNATPESATMRAIGAGLQVRSAGTAASWPAPSAGWRVPALIAIDHALFGPGWRAVRHERAPDLGSDHYPFLITAI